MMKYLRNPMHQLNNQYKIILALKEQFDEYFLMEDKDFKDKIIGIQLYSLYFISNQYRKSDSNFKNKLQNTKNLYLSLMILKMNLQQILQIWLVYLIKKNQFLRKFKIECYF
ncbi:unnamed protein product [Paramecium sonneborni]|uniref:Transmembrane protein n=1 Tax=Paramecium sonneborni TaxID=65129 RepID=A0A8S1PTK4_9CILI|nr:unnamed protein product [Paramecium sonneborni]